MANFELVILPLLIAMFFFASALLFFIWLKKKINRKGYPVKGAKMAGIFGFSLIILGCFVLFISVFFLATG